MYTYTAAGRLQTRVWKRGVTTTYAYNNAGDLQSVTYTGGSVSTPSTSYTYDRRGRRKTAVRNSITTTWTYNDADQPLTESHSGGTMSSLAMNWSYDNALRRDVLTAKYGTNILQAADYDYDTAGRLGKVKDGSQEAVYGYHPNSSLIATVALTNGPGTGAGLGVSRAYDRLNRLQSISSRAYGVAATNLPVSVGYQYNAANQRTRATLGDGTYWVYQYDALGQVVAGRRYWADGTEVAGQQFEYRFDDIGNRDTTGGPGLGGERLHGQPVESVQHPDGAAVRGCPGVGESDGQRDGQRERGHTAGRVLPPRPERAQRDGAVPDDHGDQPVWRAAEPVG
ncbi:MAG: hypothetical protein M5U12_35735 [Verrucomicrobia bacterium]|nr:hypothetical protein [Verrucomicrobiota bacterium]